MPSLASRPGTVRLSSPGLLALSVPAFSAGLDSASSGRDAPANFSPEQILAFSQKVEHVLAAQDARVAILARMGRRLAEMPPGMRFTHTAFAVQAALPAASPAWRYQIQNLYQLKRSPDKSELVQDFAGDFFGVAYELEAGIVVPSLELQARLLKLIASPDYAALHDANYSVIANPYTEGRQNCTEFVLDVISAAIHQTTDPKILKTYIRAGFEPQKIEINALKLRLGSMFVKGISLDDHDGTPVTATFEAIARYLQRFDPGCALLTVKPD